MYSYGLRWFPKASWSLTVFHNTPTNVRPWLQVYSYGLPWLAIACKSLTVFQNTPFPYVLPWLQLYSYGLPWFPIARWEFLRLHVGTFYGQRHLLQAKFLSNKPTPELLRFIQPLRD